MGCLLYGMFIVWNVYFFRCLKDVECTSWGVYCERCLLCEVFTMRCLVYWLFTLRGVCCMGCLLYGYLVCGLFTLSVFSVSAVYFMGVYCIGCVFYGVLSLLAVYFMA